MPDPLPKLAPRDMAAHPPFLHPPYRSTVLRAPAQPPIRVPQTLGERTGPVAPHNAIAGGEADLTTAHRRNGQPLGERIIVSGRVLDEAGRAVPHTLVEIWQANAAGRYIHERDAHDAPLDPNFAGAGRCITDADGHYAFTTIRPGAYPWRNHHNAWRPAHIHFSLFGPCFGTRLVTQMYFPGDPLLAFDPIFNGTPDAAARDRLVARFDLDATKAEWALAYAWDIVLRGPAQTPVEVA
jgi:protocatechuate 3,4-dioxygenase beta subunit